MAYQELKLPKGAAKGFMEALAAQNEGNLKASEAKAKAAKSANKNASKAKTTKKK